MADSTNQCQPEMDDLQQSYVDEFGLTDECHHYESLAEVPWDLQKYWQQRYSIFSLYDEGVYMTDDSWFGITPEPVAVQVASDMAASIDPSKTTIVDIFAGAGGNSIAFARSGRWEKVISIEKDPSVIACAKNNAAIYGVADKITWINDDCFDFVSKDGNIDFKTSTIFASPPWGGPGYRGDEIFNLDTMQPYSAKQIHEMCKSTECALFLPRTSDLRQIAKLAPEGDKVEVVQYCMEGASKALVAYIPASPEQLN